MDILKKICIIFLLGSTRLWALDSIEFKKIDRAKIYQQANAALNIKLSPNRRIITNKGQRVYQKHQSFFNPQEPPTFRKPVKIELVKVDKLENPTSDIDFKEYMERMDALFYALDENYFRSVPLLWSLANNNKIKLEARQRDAYFTGVIAQKAGWDAVSLVALLKVITLGPGHDDALLNDLATALDKLSDSKEIELISKRFTPEDWQKIDIDSHHNKLFSAIAKTNLDKDLKLALQAEEKMTEGSYEENEFLLFYSLYLMENGGAGKAQQYLEKLNQEAPKDIQDQAKMNLARIYLKQNKANDALALYKTVSRTGMNKLDLLLETAYAEFATGDYDGSLGKTVGIQSLYFQYGFAPDAYMLEAYSRKAICDFGGAEFAIQKLKKIYMPELEAMRRIAAQKVKSPEYSIFTELKDSYQKPNAMRFHRYMMHLPEVNKSYTMLNNWAKEYNSLKNYRAPNSTKLNPVLIQNWNVLLNSLYAFYDEQKKQIMPHIENEIITEIKYLGQRLNKTFEQAELLTVDISLAAEQDQTLQAALNYPTAAKAKTPDVTVSQILWPFENEIWEDELDYLRTKNPPRCTARNVNTAPTPSTAPVTPPPPTPITPN